MSEVQKTGKFRDDEVYAVDFETMYDTKNGYSLTSMPTWQYCASDRFDPYLVAIAGRNLFPEGTPTPGYANDVMMAEYHDGVQLYVGRPEEFKWWDRLNHHVIAMHNASFDEVVILECVKRGIIPNVLTDVEYVCTADLSAFLMCRRSLKDTMKHLFGEDISKEVRAGMDGRHDYELGSAEYRALVEYGGSDALECLRIWTEFSGEWPEVERKLSSINREATIRGIRLDADKVQSSLKEAKAYRSRVLCDIPWTTEIDPKTHEFKSAGSLPALRRAVIDMGIEPPPTFKKDSPVFLSWLEEHENIPFIKARQDAVSASVHIARLQSMNDTMDPEGRSHPVFMYAGSHTLRFSGKSTSGKSSGNLLNLPRKPLFKGIKDINGGNGIDIRGMYVADPGCTFVIADWSQVEPRITMWLAGDYDKFEAIKKEGNLYQMNAVAMGWCKSGCDLKHTDDQMYKTAKAVSIGATYGLGPAKFVDYCKGMGFDLDALPVDQWGDVDRRAMFIIRNLANIEGDIYAEANRHKVGQLLNSIRVIDDWRRANPKIVQLWSTYADIFKSRVAAGKDTVAYRLPNGYVKRYFHPHLAKEPTTVVDEDGKRHPSFRVAMKATLVHGDAPVFIKPGTIVENLVQGFGRQLLGNVIVEMQEDHPEWPYVLSVYDEVVIQCPEKDAEYALSELSRVMCHGRRISAFTKGLPLEVEGTISKCYTK